MIYAILHEALGLRLFGYISVRVAMAALTAFAFALWWGAPVIAWLKRHRVREDVTKTDAPELAKMAKASGKGETPTMGGSFLVAALLASMLLWGRLDNLHVVLGILLGVTTVCAALVEEFFWVLLLPTLAVAVGYGAWRWRSGRSAG